MNTYHPEDSLDNLSNLQINRQKHLQAQVKQHFTTALQKLQSPETREVGIAELKKIIEQYREQDYLRGYLAILKALKPNSNSGTKEHEILVISLLTQTYKQQLLDPLDKPPSLLKTAFRVVEILHGYFNDHSPTVQQACARALLDLNTHCLSQQSLQTKFSIIYAPLISILKSGVDKSSQATASACLAELIHYSRRVNDEELLRRLSPEMLSVILKVNSQYHELFHAVLGMLESQGLPFLEGRLVAFLSKIVPVVDGSREANSVNTTNLNTYMCKVNVCKILQKVAKLLPSSEREKLIELRIPDSLQQAARHRIIQVQLAAGKALKAWRGEPSEDSPPKSRGLSLEEKRNSKKLERSKSKEEREKIESELTFMKEDLQKLVRGGWGAANRAKNYVKKGSGIGGGFHGHSEVSPPSKSPGKSHKEHLQQLRQFIKKSAKDNKNIDRFGQVRSQGGERSKSPPAKGKSPTVRSKSPASRSKSPGNNLQKRSSKGDEQGEIGFKEDEGDQMVNLPYQRSDESKSVKSKGKWQRGQDGVKNNRFQDYGISQAEARDLIEHEQSLMDHGNKNNINYTQMSQDRSVGYTIPKDNQLYLPLNQKNNEKKEKNTKQQPTKGKSTPQLQQMKGISEQELGQLVQQYNLSQVSEDLNQILNQSDLKAFKNADQVIDISTPDVQKLKEMIADKKQKTSALSKFTKKDEPELKEQLVQAKQNAYQPGQSLDFTVSNESKAKSPVRREEIQFTLNPKDRFSNVKQQSPLAEKDKEIEEQIAMSQYQQSFPRDQPLPMILPKVAPITQIPLRYSLVQPKYEQVHHPHPQPEQKVDFQKLIKNPPKKQVINQVSGLKGSKASAKSEIPQSKVQNQQTEDEDLKNKWLQIVKCAQQSQTNYAYELALQLDDPIYLLRLMLISKLKLKKLSPETVRQLWRKFMEIYSQRFIDVITVGLLSEGNELGLLSKCLSVQQVQDSLVGLYELSGNTRGKLSYKAATLYNQIQKKMQGN